MSIVWVGLLIFSVLSALLTGHNGALTGVFLEGAASGIDLCVALAGSLCLWSGFAKVMEEAGLTEKLGQLMAPIFRRLFPHAGQDKVVLGFLTANVSANLLGLGNAATPMGIAAVKRMQTLSGSQEATDEQCLLIVMNTASLQLLPTTVAAVRAAQGADAPFAILPAVWMTSAVSVTVGILAAKLMGKAAHD